MKWIKYLHCVGEDRCIRQPDGDSRGQGDLKDTVRSRAERGGEDLGTSFSYRDPGGLLGSSLNRALNVEEAPWGQVHGQEKGAPSKPSGGMEVGQLGPWQDTGPGAQGADMARAGRGPCWTPVAASLDWGSLLWGKWSPTGPR